MAPTAGREAANVAIAAFFTRSPPAFALSRARERAKAGGERVKNAAMATFAASRPAVGAMAVGTGRAAYEVALDSARTRAPCGRPMTRSEGVAFQLAYI